MVSQLSQHASAELSDADGIANLPYCLISTLLKDPNLAASSEDDILLLVAKWHERHTGRDIDGLL